MKLWVILAALVFAAGAFLLIGVFAEDSIQLGKGKNNVSVPFEVLASELVRLNPEIEVISFRDDSGRSAGYINAYGGLGKNFYLNPLRSYEISVREEINLRF